MKKSLLITITVLSVLVLGSINAFAMIMPFDYVSFDEATMQAEVKLSEHYGFENSLKMLGETKGLDILESDVEAGTAKVQINDSELAKRVKQLTTVGGPQVRMALASVDETAASEDAPIPVLLTATETPVPVLYDSEEAPQPELISEEPQPELISEEPQPETIAEITAGEQPISAKQEKTSSYLTIILLIAVLLAGGIFVRRKKK